MARHDKPSRPAEDAAEIVTVSGWSCKHCHRFYGKNEGAARYCCSTDFPCECGGRREKHFARCRACRDREDHEKWFGRPAVEWDGELPIGDWSSDRYFFDEDELRDYDGDLSECWLTTCKPVAMREFDAASFVSDDLPEDVEIDCDEINKTVNDWLAAKAPKMYQMTGVRLDMASVLKQLGMEGVENES